MPLRLPSELVRQRPDIRASEALLHKASANVGVATADLYPKLVISGSFSSSQLNLSDVLGNGINVWNIGANLLQPLFRGGELQARKRAAEAAYDQAAAGYRQSVLLGLQNVADVLRALEADAGAHAARAEQAARADDVFRITLARYDAGGREPARGARRRPEPAAGRDRPDPGRCQPVRGRGGAVPGGRRGLEVGEMRVRLEFPARRAPMYSGGEIRV